MALIPLNAAEKLEFHKIIELVQQECLSTAAAHQVQSLKPSSDLEFIRRELDLTDEYLQSILINNALPLQAFPDIRPALEVLEISGSTWDSVDFFATKQQLALLNVHHVYFEPEQINLKPLLYNGFKALNYDQTLYSTIDGIIDDKGEVRDNASPELVRITNQIKQENISLERTFRKLLQEYRKSGYLSESEESIRNGRRVMSVHSEHKRKFKGIIHDESTTGKTAYVEPEDIVHINNNLFDLEMDRRREVYRILKTLSADLRPHVPALINYQTYLEALDFTRAKAFFAYRIGAHKPQIMDCAAFELVKAVHPLLSLRNKAVGKKTVPMSLRLGSEKRLLLISGPNAGGKSVCLKTVGLLQWMIQSGLLVTASPISEFGIFSDFLIDIGDQQSIADDLSTYSSRLNLCRQFIEVASPQSLVLIDEFGSGTDPKIGGAIAEGVLLEVHRAGALALITTHYSNLKLMVSKIDQAINGAMLFDIKTLRPTYQLSLGRPGSSYALEIAKHCGLPEQVIEYARNKIGPQAYQVEKLLNDLELEKEELQKALKDSQNKATNLEKLIQTYNQMNKDLEVRRKKLQLEAKQKTLQESQHYKRELERLYKESKSARQQEDKLTDLLSQVKSEQEDLRANIVDLYEEVDEAHSGKPIQIGDFVKHLQSDWIGQVTVLEKEKAQIQVGDLRVTVPIRELRPSRTPLPIRSNKSVAVQVSKSNFDFNNQLDLRGLKPEDAEKVVSAFIDQGVLSEAFSLKILHGKGHGTLKKLVWNKLKEYSSIKSVYHPEPNQGGEGITIAVLR